MNDPSGAAPRPAGATEDLRYLHLRFAGSGRAPAPESRPRTIAGD
jgi:hypothetical protein